MKRYMLFPALLALLAGSCIGLAKPPAKEAIAKYAWILGNNRLARQTDDRKGLVLVRFAGILQPGNHNIKGTLRAVQNGRAPKPIATKMTMDRLAGAMGQRVSYLLQQKTKAHRQRALLYLRVMEAFDPMNKKITYAIAGLEKKGVKGDLAALLGLPPEETTATEQREPAAQEQAEADEVAEAPAQPAAEAPAQGGYDEAGNPLPRPKTDYSKLKAPAEWITFAKARDQQDLNGQVAILAKRYAKLCPAAKYKTKDGLEVRGVPPIVEAAQGTPDQILNMELDGRGTLNTLSPLFGMPLEVLTITRPRGSSLDLGPLRASPLKILRIVRADDLEEIKNLDKLNLLALELTQCPHITDLDFLKGATMKALNLVNCRRLDDIDALEDLKLSGLGLTNCPQISNLRPLRNTPLTKVKLIRCNNLRSIGPLEKLPIEELTVQDCEDLTDRDLIFSIQKMESLKQLDAPEAVMQRVNLKD